MPGYLLNHNSLLRLLQMSKLRLRSGDPPGSLAADNLGLHRVLRPLRLGQLYHPGLGRVGRCAAGLRGRHKYVSGWLGGHRLPGRHSHQHLLPESGPLGHGPLQCWHGHPQPAPQAVLLLPRLPHVPGARG
ncbi:type-1 angiotensin II receptor-associated protein isoform X7 [Camelus dromedarius]